MASMLSFLLVLATVSLLAVARFSCASLDLPLISALRLCYIAW